jgi:hypothetical protein
VYRESCLCAVFVRRFTVDSNPNQIIYKNLNGYAVTKVLVPMLI